MKKQEIKKAVDLISHYYSSATWYGIKRDITNNYEKASRERSRADAIELFMLDVKHPVVIHKDDLQREYAVSCKLDNDKVYIRWVSTACQPWDDISFSLFREEVEYFHAKGYRIFTTDGTQDGMKEMIR